MKCKLCRIPICTHSSIDLSTATCLKCGMSPACRTLLPFNSKSHPDLSKDNYHEVCRLCHKLFIEKNIFHTYKEDIF